MNLLRATALYYLGGGRELPDMLLEHVLIIGVVWTEDFASRGEEA